MQKRTSKHEGRPRIRTIRAAVVLVLIAAITVGYITNYSVGTFSVIGWKDFAMLCPLGAFETMLASKSFVLKAIVSLVATVAVFALCGRAFCAWVCPVPLVSRIPAFLRKLLGIKKKDGQESLPANGRRKPAAKKGCEACVQKRGHLDSRHVVLGASLLSAFVFGFPVFCVICPVGLTIAAILLVVQLFAVGEVTWTLLFAPLVLAVEVVFFRKWCSVICPLSAVTSLLSKMTITMKLRIDDKKCLETSQGKVCGACAKVCPEKIDPRHPERSFSLMCECTKCYECVEACPTKALRIPFFPWKTGAYARVADAGEARLADAGKAR
ncbi:MAG: 4Fe-4S binding protein, partial [Coriobacteriaceae bacterium]|nr:4Fe-4S binding protein [Coriobacteriaceae bacterium]